MNLIRKKNPLHTKQYLDVVVVSHKGTVSNNPLKLSEGHLIPPLAENNKSLLVKHKSCTQAQYDCMFRI